MFGGEYGVLYDVCYYEFCDDIQNLNFIVWEINIKVCIDL